MAVHVLTLVVDLHLPACRSLKDKRAVVRSMVDGARRRYEVAGSETDCQDQWQRAELAFVGVAGSSGHVTRVIDALERFVWSFPEAEVVGSARHWLEVD